jgi:hypothetical protein
MEALRAGLDLVAEFEAAGTPYSELDENGQVVVHHPEASRGPNSSGSNLDEPGIPDVR